MTSPWTSDGTHVPRAHAALARPTGAERDQVVEYVKTAYAEGRCDEAELEQALEQAITARTGAELLAIVTELYGDQVPPPAAVPRPPPPGGGARTVAGLAHLLAPLGLPILGPAAVLLLGGHASPHVRRHAVEALNFQLTVVGASFALPFTVVGVLLVPVIWVAAFVLSILAGVAALRGEETYRYPYTLRPIKESRRRDHHPGLTADPGHTPGLTPGPASDGGRPLGPAGG
ncbi:DUF1707 and DUF4870 domain-containing protein [Nonomuraea sp. NPDC050310]|uniref:DUF1707 and DUF4870 domain-containing protein n=1 Tax=unclassified Nonomuraea TaxID=2593643 RepID=UPI0033E62781